MEYEVDDEEEEKRPFRPRRVLLPALRCRWVSGCLMAGLCLMDTLGHSNIGMTMDLYAHVVPALQWDAADRMYRVLRLGA